jgi:phospholipid-transporting ATPase
VTRETYPSLYRVSQNSELFNHRQFWKWIAVSLFHSVLLFWLPLGAMSTGISWESGRYVTILITSPKRVI